VEIMPYRPKTRVFMDGSCSFCRAVQSRIGSFDARERVEFVNYHQEAIAAEAPFPLAELDAQMHVLAPDGSWKIGFFGWAAILRELPAWRWMGWLMIAPPFRWFGPALYRWIARHRYSLPGMPPPCDEHGCGLAHADHSAQTIAPGTIPHHGGTE
jgi:predicted DCC family thiol-disulfide oxidoreductase YuxK